MWQTIVVLFVIAAVLIYVVRHYVLMLRGKASICCEGAGGCPASAKNGCGCGAEISKRTEAK